MVYEVLPDSALPFDFDPLQVPVVAYSPFDTGINGSTFIEVTKEEEENNILMEFLRPSNIQVWPTLKGGNFSGKNSGSNNIQKSITVKVTKNGDPFPNKEVVITPRMILPSGGHDHLPAPSESLLGEITFIDDPVTDQKGIILFDYKAPRFSGTIELTARVVFEGKIYSATRPVTVKVFELDPLVQSDYFELIGAPDNNTNTNDPCRPPPTLTSRHFSNHYGTPEMNNAIRLIAKDYNLTDENVKLRINDISLIWGGLFDIGNNWLEPHSEHAIGKQADIGLSGIDENKVCVELPKRDLVKSISRYTNEKTHSESDHYHIRVK